MYKKLIDCCLIKTKENSCQCIKFTDYIKGIDPKIINTTKTIFMMTNELDLYCPFISHYGKGVELKWSGEVGNQVRVIIEPNQQIIYFIRNHSRQSELYYRSALPSKAILNEIYERVNV